MLKDLVKYSDGKYASWVNMERSQCIGKVAFETKALARAVARRERKGITYEAYACKACGKWHVGNHRSAGP